MVLLYIGSMYTMAIIGMIWFALLSGIEVNGRHVGVIVRAVCGFVFGMAVEAMIFMIIGTWAILANKINLD